MTDSRLISSILMYQFCTFHVMYTWNEKMSICQVHIENKYNNSRICTSTRVNYNKHPCLVKNDLFLILGMHK